MSAAARAFEDVAFETSVTYNLATREFWLSFTSQANQLRVVCHVISALACVTKKYTEFVGLTHGGRGVFTLRFKTLAEVGAFLDWLEHSCISLAQPRTGGTS